MKNQLPRQSARSAFTLIEILVVIAIIGVLAGLIIGVAGSAMNKGHVKRVQAEMAALNSAIEAYKAKKGFYPPDNPVSSSNYSAWWCGQTNPLYYELKGTVSSNTANPVSYRIIDGIDWTDAKILDQYCNVSGIANSSASTTGAGSDDVAGVETFGKGITAKQAQPIVVGGRAVNLKLIIVPLSDPDGNIFNPWHYNSSKPKYNTSTYDLWAVVKLGGKTNIICNWSDSPIVPKTTDVY